MPQIIDQRTSIDNTVKVFDAFYEFDSVINGNEFDIVSGYFRLTVKSKKIADNMTAGLFRVAQETQVPVLDLLDNLKGTSNVEMNQVMAFYLNSFKSKTALYGYSAVPAANPSVARNIVI